MVLAQWLMKSKEYHNFYKRQMDEQLDWVVIDNGVYEDEQVSDEKLYALVMEFIPDAVVLPDAPGEFAETVTRSMRFARRLERAGATCETWFVLQGKTEKELILAYQLQEEFTGVCFPKRQACMARATHRVELITKLQREGLWRNETTHHALGMIDGSLHEAAQLAKLGVDSIDSSAPVWRPLHGFALGDPNWGHYQLQVDTAVEFSEYNVQLAVDSIKTCQSKLR